MWVNLYHYVNTHANIYDANKGWGRTQANCEASASAESCGPVNVSEEVDFTVRPWPRPPIACHAVACFLPKIQGSNDERLHREPGSSS